jgi:hypothetical protein
VIVAALLACALFGSESLRVRVMGPGGAVPGARVVASGAAASLVAQTDRTGLALLPLPVAGSYVIEASAPGYLTLRQSLDLNSGAAVEIEMTLAAATGNSQSITVVAPPGGTDAGASPTAAVTPGQLKPLPTDPATVRDALPLIPGVLRSPEGKLRIAGAAEHHSTLLLNRADVTDPATGKFGATVPIDAVALLTVYKSPFLAEYGRFTAGVVAVETRSGGEKWRWELNDPTPELRIRSRHLRGVRGYTPRLSWSGPLVRNRLFFSEALEYALNKTPVFTLLFPRNESKREAWNSLTQVDALVSPAHWLTFTLHGAPQRINFANLSFYNPQPVAPSFRGAEYAAALSDRFTIAGGVLESALSFGQVLGRTGAQGDAEMTLMPAGNTGSYFARQDRRAERFQWLETWTPAPLDAAGKHHWKLGGTVLRTRARGWYQANPVNIRDFEGVLRRRLEFENQPGYHLSDWETAAFAHDHWLLTPRIAVDAGARLDAQAIPGTARIAPRAAVSWAPFSDAATSFRAGLGWFYDRVPLSVYAFDHYPLPGVGFASTRFAPSSRTWSIQAEHRFPKLVRLRASYLETQSSGLITLRPVESTFLLGGAGVSRYRQLELIARVSWQANQEVFLSYVNARSWGNLNEFTEFLGDFSTPVVRPDVIADMPGSTPHRLLAWGVVPLAKGISLAPVIEYRTGFPYSALDAAQDYAGPPNSRRFPNFFSLDLRVAKDIRFRKHAVQLSMSWFNVTNHWNPDTVRWNIADPQFGEFLGHHRRRYRVDLDFLF